jgi:hypothetical protein
LYPAKLAVLLVLQGKLYVRLAPVPMPPPHFICSSSASMVVSPETGTLLAGLDVVGVGMRGDKERGDARR